jgi:hypothetical protein
VIVIVAAGVKVPGPDSYVSLSQYTSALMGPEAETNLVATKLDPVSLNTFDPPHPAISLPPSWASVVGAETSIPVMAPDGHVLRFPVAVAETPETVDPGGISVLPFTWLYAVELDAGTVTVHV